MASSISSSHQRIVKVGLIGCGEIAQVVHIPTLGFLNDHFQVTYLCDVSRDSLKHCEKKIAGGANGVVVKTTTDSEDLCSSPDVDVVFVLNSNEFHADHAILALRHDKYVFIEKPAAVNLRDLKRIQDAEAEASAGKGGERRKKVMIGYMRRYASAFQEAVRIIGGMDKVVYARVRDIIGPNSAFVSQSGTFPRRFSDFSVEDSRDLEERCVETVGAGLAECGVEATESNRLLWRLLGGLGSHDLSAMREALGMPVDIHGAAARSLFWTAIFKYPNFDLLYESGIDGVPRFDAHIEVYGQDKTVRIQYDTPYVKGLPITVHVAEKDGDGEGGGYKETTLRPTYEDAYTQEMRELYAWVVSGGQEEIKTTLADAEDDFRLFGMIMRALKP